MSLRGLDIISMKLFLLREMTGILSWCGLRLDKNTKKCDMLSGQNPNSSSWHSRTKDPNYIISNITIQCTLVLITPDISLLPSVHIKHSSHSLFRLITPPGILSSLSYPHLCHQSKSHSLSMYITDDQDYLGPFQNSRQIWTFFLLLYSLLVV